MTLLAEELERLVCWACRRHGRIWTPRAQLWLIAVRPLNCCMPMIHLMGTLVLLWVCPHGWSALLIWQVYSPCLMAVIFSLTVGCVVVISSSAPHDAKPEAEKNAFYAVLDDIISTSSWLHVVILGELNGRIGHDGIGFVLVLGPHSLSEERSDNGMRLLELAFTHRLFLMTTWFQHNIAISIHFDIHGVTVKPWIMF